MHFPLCLIIFTSNILGSFNDPFEFDGDYGDELNPIREVVFEQVVSREALARDTSKRQIQGIESAIQVDREHGPTLSELISTDLMQLLLSRQQELQSVGFSEEDVTSFHDFVEKYGNQKVFSFFRHHPPELSTLDKPLRDQATREGRHFDLPILSSTELLSGTNAFELKANLLDALFTKETLQSVTSNKKLSEVIEALEPEFLQFYLGEEADNDDLAIFASPAGQVFFYWLYQSLNLHLIAQDEGMIAQINEVKQTFATTLGDPVERGRMFREKLIAADASVVFTQESDAIVPQLLCEEEIFHSIERQNGADGTLVFLRRNVWEPDYERITIDDYDGYAKGKMNVIVATLKESEEKFLLASGHGNSTHAEDGRLQITKVAEKFRQLKEMPEYQGLQLIIGIDANTKTDEDVSMLRELLDTLGLVATDVGPTTIKKRMVTVQHSKAGRFAVDEEDYIIILKPENGGRYLMANPTVGFREEKPNLAQPLPNMNNPSDHYPVGVTLVQ